MAQTPTSSVTPPRCGCRVEQVMEQDFPNPARRPTGTYRIAKCPLCLAAPALWKALDSLYTLTMEIVQAPGGWEIAKDLPEWRDQSQLAEAQRALKSALAGGGA